MIPDSPPRWNRFAAAAASLAGFTGFTLVMPFLFLYFQQLGVRDLGAIALWSGLSLGVLTTASLTGLALSPILSGLLGSASLRAVFLVDAGGLAALTWFVARWMGRAADAGG